MRGACGTNGDWIGDLRGGGGEPLDGWMWPHGLHGTQEGCALRQRFEPALGGGGEGCGQLGGFGQQAFLACRDGAPGLGEEDRVRAPGAVHQHVLDPVTERGGVLHLALLDYPFQAVRVGEAAHRKRRRQPRHEAGEGGSRVVAAAGLDRAFTMRFVIPA